MKTRYGRIPLKVQVDQRQHTFCLSDMQVGGQPVRQLESGQSLTLTIGSAKVLSSLRDSRLKVGEIKVKQMAKLSCNNLTVQFSGMKRTQVLCGLWLSLLLALGGCSSETDFLPAPVGTDIQLAVSIETPSVNGRMQTGPSGNEAFQLSDRISLWVTSMDQSGAMSHAPAIHPVQAAASGADCYTLEWTEHGWMPALSWKDLTGEHFQFRAVYPAQPDALSEGFVHTVATDQREAVHYGSSDLLLASATVQRGQVVELHFRHQMSLIEVNLTSARTFTAEQLAQAEVRVRACSSIEVEGRPFLPNFRCYPHRSVEESIP